MKQLIGTTLAFVWVLTSAHAAYAASAYTCSVVPVDTGSVQPRYVFPTSLNNQQQAAGTWFDTVNGFAVDSQGISIPFTPPAGQTIRQLAVNNHGQIAGWYGDPSGSFGHPPVIHDQGFISNPDGTFALLDLPPNTGTETFHDNWVHSINDNGDILGEVMATKSDGSVSQFWYVRNAAGAYTLFDEHSFFPFNYYVGFQTEPALLTGTINNDGTAVFPATPLSSNIRFADGSEKTVSFPGSSTYPWLTYGINNQGFMVANLPKYPYTPSFSVLITPDGHAPAIVCPDVNTVLAFSVNDNGVIGAATSSGTMVLATPTGAHPAVTLSNTNWGFSPNPVGVQGGSGIMYLSNHGTADLHIQSITLGSGQPGDSPADFSFGSDTTCVRRNPYGGPIPRTFAPGEFCTVSFTFKPTDTGARRAQIEIWDDAPDAPHIIRLDGTGLGKQNLVLSNTSWNLGTFPVGQTSPPGTIYIYNPGTDPVNISGIQITGPNSSDVQITDNTCGSAFAPFQTCSITFIFTPGAAGFRNAALTIANDSPTNPQTIPMTGFSY